MRVNRNFDTDEDNIGRKIFNDKKNPIILNHFVSKNQDALGHTPLLNIMKFIKKKDNSRIRNPPAEVTRHRSVPLRQKK